MNKLDNDRNAKGVDSLLNFETVSNFFPKIFWLDFCKINFILLLNNYI